MMFGCYMDESYDMKETGFYAVGGFITGGEAAFELERKWEKLLKCHRLAYYKASQCESGTGEFRDYVANPKKITDKERQKLDAISHEFCQLIGNPIEHDDRPFLCVFGVAVVQRDFYGLIKNPEARAVLGPSPYRLAYDLAMIQAAWVMKQFCKGKRNHCVSYICDQDEEHSALAPSAYRDLVKKNPQAARYMCSYSMEDEKTCSPVQAADAVIYEIRKVLKYSKGEFETKLRSQFQMLADRRMILYVGYTELQQLEWIVANHKPGQPFKLDMLMKLQIKEDKIDKLRG